MSKVINNTEQKKSIDDILTKINKIHGVGSAMRLTDTPVDIDVISSGSLGLDLALGVGGFPRGRIVEIYGGESSGKTTITTHVMAEAQKLGGSVAFIDAEHAFDKKYAEALGVNVDNLVFSQPDNGEQAFDICEMLLQSKVFDVIIIDSVAALVPKSEMEGEFGDNKMGLHARLMSQAMRKIVGIVKSSNTLLILINQTREKIGVVYGSPITTTGGNALKFYASIRLEVSKTAPVKDGDGNAVASPVKVKVVKNKVAPPFKTAEFEILFGVGINKQGEIIDIASDLEIIKKAGSWYSYNDMKIGQGRNSVMQFLADNPELSNEIESKVKEIITG